MTTPTNIELKQLLAKMLPDIIAMRDSYLDPRSLCRITTPDKITLCWIAVGSKVACPVLDTELLHLCWLVEEQFFPLDTNCKTENSNLYKYYVELSKIPHSHHATWQQRVNTLAKVKGISI